MPGKASDKNPQIAEVGVTPRILGDPKGTGRKEEMKQTGMQIFTLTSCIVAYPLRILFKQNRCL